MSSGVLYITTTEDYVSEAKASARSVRAAAPELPISIIAHRTVSGDVFDESITIEEPEFGWGDRVNNIRRTPYDRTIYLDSDVFVCDGQGLDDIFSLLDRFDFAAAHAQGRRSRNAQLRQSPSTPVPDSMVWFNAGVIGYAKSSRTLELFDIWEERYARHKEIADQPNDQEALIQAVYESDARIVTLPPEYNYRVGGGNQYIYGKVKLLHGHLEESQYLDVCNAVNCECGPRAFEVYAIDGHRHLERIDHSTPRRRLKRVKYSIHDRGVLGTARSIWRWVRGGQFSDDSQPQK